MALKIEMELLKVRASCEGENGELLLIKLKDTHFVIRFLSSGSSIGYDIDDIVAIDVGSKRVVIALDPPSHDHITIIILLREELITLQTMLNWCTRLSDLSLTMQSLSRDYYFAGVYSAMEKPEEAALLNSNIAALIPPDNKPFEILELSVEESNLDEATRTAILTTPCVFCRTEKRNAPGIDFFIHPYVPFNYSGASIAMCDTCLAAWQKHRDMAIRANELVLDGEENEELCGICSDTPAEIVMCSSCVRSFCNHCLQQVLTTQELLDMQKELHWVCMICSHGSMHKDPLPRGRWTKIEFINTSYSPYDFEVSPVSLSFPMRPLRKRTTDEDETAMTLVKRKGKGRPKGADRDADGTPAKSSKRKSEPALTADNAEELIAAAPKTSKIKTEALLDVEVPKPKKSRGSKMIAAALQSEGTFVAPNATVLGAPSAATTDVFLQYHDFIVKQRSVARRGKPLNLGTEDCCFLCKDGGDLVECDHFCGPMRCLKVYHEECLCFKVQQSDKEKWTCPRHFCDMCGEQDIAFACQYCPLSFCGSCKYRVAIQLDKARYVPINFVVNYFAVASKHEANQAVQFIICQGCLEDVDRSVALSNVERGVFTTLPEKSFLDEAEAQGLMAATLGVPVGGIKRTRPSKEEAAKRSSGRPPVADKAREAEEVPTLYKNSNRDRKLAQKYCDEWTPEAIAALDAALQRYYPRLTFASQLSQNNYDDLILRPGMGILQGRTLGFVRAKVEELLRSRVVHQEPQEDAASPQGRH